MKFTVNTSISKNSGDNTKPNFEYKLISKKHKEFLFLL